MIKWQNIPDEAAEAAFRAWCRAMAAPNVGPAMREAIAAALNAWPGMMDATKMVLAPEGPRPVPAIIIPLATEKETSDE